MKLSNWENIMIDAKNTGSSQAAAANDVQTAERAEPAANSEKPVSSQPETAK